MAALALTAIGGGAAADTFTLRIGSGHPNGPSVYVTDVAEFFVPEVTRRVAGETDHEIVFVEGYGGSIAGVFETLEAVQDGILDIGAYCICFEPAKLFLHNFPYYAPFGPTDSIEQMEATRATYEALPWLKDQFPDEYGQVLLGLHGWDNYHLGTTDPWQTVEDLQGVKIAGAGPNLPWLEFAGAVPVSTNLPEAYLALQTGVYHGFLMFPSAYLGFKFYEPSPNFTLISFGAMSVNALTMNQRSFDRLPEDVQRILLEVGAEYEAGSGANLNAKQASGIEGLIAQGTNVRELPAEARAGWAAAMAAFPNRQAKDADGRGMPGSEVMRTYIDIVSEMGYEWPVEYVID